MDSVLEDLLAEVVQLAADADLILARLVPDERPRSLRAEDS